jgi:hypothetical protein
VLGRIRSRNLASAEVEYRFDLRDDGLLSAVAFGSLTAMTTDPEATSSRPDRAGESACASGSARSRNFNLTVDAGWGEQGSFGMFRARQGVLSGWPVGARRR